MRAAIAVVRQQGAPIDGRAMILPPQPTWRNVRSQHADESASTLWKVRAMVSISAPEQTRSRESADARPAREAFILLRTVFTVAPILFGLDKFTNLMTEWPDYLAPWINDIVPGTGQEAMYAIGVVEILAGLVVASAPRFGGLLVAAWLAGIIVNLLSIPDYYDVALRDFGLMVAALALWRLAVAHSAGTPRWLARR
jgi:hypothetical protein